MFCYTNVERKYIFLPVIDNLASKRKQIITKVTLNKELTTFKATRKDSTCIVKCTVPTMVE